MANLVAQELGLKLDSEECDFLKGGSIAPDKWKDYPHHFKVDHKIRTYILQSRRHFIDGHTTAHLECLGIAFHYIADKWTLFSGSTEEHTEWEKKLDKCKVAGDLNKILRETLSDHQELLQQYLTLLRALYTVPTCKDDIVSFAFQSRPRDKKRCLFYT